jgi:hypothetical protein
MRPVKHSDLTKKNDRNATPFTLADLRAQLRKQRLYVAPLDVGLVGRAKSNSSVRSCFRFML